MAEMSGRWKENSSRPDGCGPLLLLLPPRHAHDAQLVCEGTEQSHDPPTSKVATRSGGERGDGHFGLTIRTLQYFIACPKDGTLHNAQSK